MRTTNQNRMQWLALVFTLATGAQHSIAAEQGDTKTFVDEQFAFASRQYAGILEDLNDREGSPRTFEDGKLVLTKPHGWTSGFFPGSLWLLYEQTGEIRWKQAAVKYTSSLESASKFAGHHDIGFILNCSYGEGYRLTHDETYRKVLIEGASTLCTRFSPKVGLIRSWDGPRWIYPVIIDNMMNLELLMFASKEAKTNSFRDIAISHANKTMEYHFRPDGSSFHVVDFDPETGAVIAQQTAQGYSDASAWARGQAWGLYGFTMMHRFTGDRAYLLHARKIADFLIGHTNMPADKVPYWDFDAPNIPNEPRDASAAAIMASALIELGDFVDSEPRQRYQQFATDQLRSLSSPVYRADLGENGHFILKHSVGSKPRNSEIDVPLVYADYYYLEGLSRLKARIETGLSSKGAQINASGTPKPSTPGDSSP